MKKHILFVMLLTFSMAVTAHAGVNVGINIGIPVPLPSNVVIQSAPEFIYQPQLGFHVSVGAPYDVMYISNSYYLYNNGYYYRSRSYNGPWEGVEYKRLPKGLRNHRYEEIRQYRDKEYRRYDRDREHYNGRWHRPGEANRGEGRGNEGRGGEHRGDDRGGKQHGEGHGGEHRSEGRGDERR